MDPLRELSSLKMDSSVAKSCITRLLGASEWHVKYIQRRGELIWNESFIFNILSLSRQSKISTFLPINEHRLMVGASQLPSSTWKVFALSLFFPFQKENWVAQPTKPRIPTGVDWMSLSLHYQSLFLENRFIFLLIEAHSLTTVEVAPSSFFAADYVTP